MSEYDQVINPNTADLEELTHLPGVGEALAKRIIEGRPFESVEDLQNVPGLGARTLERIASMIDFNITDEAVADVSGGLPLADQDLEISPEIREKAAGTNKRIGFTTRSQVLGISAASAAVGVVVSILLLLSIFIGINGTLNFSRHPSVRELAAGMKQVEDQLDEVNTTLESIDQRLGALEGLSGRMTDLEDETASLEMDMQNALTQVQRMRTQVDQISLQIEELVRRTQSQLTFFERLQVLLKEVFGSQVEGSVR